MNYKLLLLCTVVGTSMQCIHAMENENCIQFVEGTRPEEACFEPLSATLSSEDMLSCKEETESWQVNSGIIAQEAIYEKHNVDLERERVKYWRGIILRNEPGIEEILKNTSSIVIHNWLENILMNKENEGLISLTQKTGEVLYMENIGCSGWKATWQKPTESKEQKES